LLLIPSCETLWRRERKKKVIVSLQVYANAIAGIDYALDPAECGFSKEHHDLTDTAGVTSA
jgi:hypothetical protein